jgi:hypothetical protein
MCHASGSAATKIQAAVRLDLKATLGNTSWEKHQKSNIRNERRKERRKEGRKEGYILNRPETNPNFTSEISPK